MKKLAISIVGSCVLSLGAVAPLYADIFSNTPPVDLVEPAGIYQLNDPDVVLMTVKTLTNAGSCQSSDDYAYCTFQDVLTDFDPDDNFNPEIKVLLTTNDLASEGEVANAKLRIRGHASRTAPQKSFRIKLKSKKNLWRGERRIQLIKSVYDFARIRNALSYELLTSIPALPSLRTQFVNLYLDDNGTSTDHGLYTHVEHVGKEFMVNRNWNKDSAVYKAEDFLFKNRSEFALDSKGKPVDKDAFERRLEIKSGKNHTKFKQMLVALNNPKIDFNTQIMGKYFNQENYLAWFAFNILINNTDTIEQNFYLYNPKGKDVFYFMSWDNDYAWAVNLDDPRSTIEQQPRWWYSAANWWDSQLHKRFLTQPGNLQLLKNAVTEMRNKYLTSAKIKAITDKYYPLVFPYVTRDPDLDDLYVQGDTLAKKQADYTHLYHRLKNNVEQNYQLFMARADDPMTFYIDEKITLKNNQIKFGWEASISLLKHAVSYDLEIATEPTFTDASRVQRVSNIADVALKLNWSHPAGTYYYRVIARDVQNPTVHWQIGENYFDELMHPVTGEPIRGVVKFVIQQEGTAPITNATPVAHNTTVSTHTHIVTPIILHTVDADGDAISISIIDQPAHGILSNPDNGLRLKYTPNVGYIGSDRFSYKASDGKSQSSVATVSIQVKKKPSSTSTSVPQVSNAKKGGGAMSWMYLLLFAILLFVRRHPAKNAVESYQS